MYDDMIISKMLIQAAKEDTLIKITNYLDICVLGKEENGCTAIFNVLKKLVVMDDILKYVPIVINFYNYLNEKYDYKIILEGNYLVEKIKNEKIPLSSSIYDSLEKSRIVNILGIEKIKATPMSNLVNGLTCDE